MRYTILFLTSCMSDGARIITSNVNQLVYTKGTIAPPYIDSFWEPFHVPSTQAFDIFDNNLEVFKIDCRHCVKANVE